MLCRSSLAASDILQYVKFIREFECLQKYRNHSVATAQKRELARCRRVCYAFTNNRDLITVTHMPARAM